MEHFINEPIGSAHLVKPGQDVEVILRFSTGPRIDHNLHGYSYEQEWIRNRIKAAKGEKLFWFFVPSVNREIACWSKQLKNLEALEAISYGTQEWTVPQVKQFFQSDPVHELLNKACNPILEPVLQSVPFNCKLHFESAFVIDVYKDLVTQEFVVKLKGTTQSTSTSNERVDLFTLLYTFMRNLRLLSSGGELVHLFRESDKSGVHELGPLFLTTRDRVYNIWDNGSIPFRVHLLEPFAYVFEVQYNEDLDVEGYRWSLKIPYARALVGINLDNSMTRFSGSVKNRAFNDGNSIVLTLPNREEAGPRSPPFEDRHIWIGEYILEFYTKDESLVRLLSPIGNSGVPYPWILSDTNRVYLPKELMSFPIPYGQELGFGATPQIVRIPDDALDPYLFMWEREQSSAKLDKMRKQLGVGKTFGFTGSNPDSEQYQLKPYNPTVVTVKDDKGAEKGRNVQRLETLEDAYKRWADASNSPTLIYDDKNKEFIERDRPPIEPVPWIEQADGTRKDTTKEELMSILESLTELYNMSIKSLPLYKPRILVTRVLDRLP